MFLPDPAPSGPCLAVASEKAYLTVEELNAIAVGRADATGYVWHASLPSSVLKRQIRRFVRLLTGIEGANPLANERLEKLRLFACMLRRGDRRFDGFAAELIEQGYQPRALHQAIRAALA